MSADREHTPVAIIGYSYRLPGGIKTDEDFWKLLSTRGYVQEPIENRYGKGECPWDAAQGGFADSPSRVACPYEGLITDDDELKFDCALFGMSPNDAKRLDPQIKMMLSATWEALERAGLDQSALHNSNTGVFTGQQVSSIAGWRPPFGATAGDVPGKSGSMIANRISFHFNWMGPSFSVATACSSGITALDAALKSLSLKECDVAAFGAVNYLGQEVSSGAPARPRPPAHDPAHPPARPQSASTSWASYPRRARRARSTRTPTGTCAPRAPSCTS
jgi:acyl transferase domain-containing protein